MCDLRGAVLFIVITLGTGALAEHQMDPTQPPAALSGTTPDGVAAAKPRLTSIVSRGGQRIAVVGGQTLRVGDAVGELRVVAIEASSVHLERPDGKDRLVLSLYRTPAVRQPAAGKDDR